MSNRSLERTVTILGSPCVGKSSLTLKLVEKKFEKEYTPTINKKSMIEVKHNNTLYKLTIFDTAGLTDQYASIPTTYVTQSHGFVLVYSIDDRSSFENCKDIYRNLISSSSGNVPIVLVGNKTDLENQRLVKYEEGKLLADSWQVYFLETSAQTGEKVLDIFTSCLNVIENNRNGGASSSNRTSSSSTSNDQQSSNKQDKSCIIS